MRTKKISLLATIIFLTCLCQFLHAYTCYQCRYTFSTPSKSTTTRYDSSAHWTVTTSKCPRCGYSLGTTTGPRISHSPSCSSTKKLDYTYHWTENYCRCGCGYAYTNITGKSTHSFSTTQKWNANTHWNESKCGCGYSTTSGAVNHTMQPTNYGQIHNDSTYHWWDVTYKCTGCLYNYPGISAKCTHEKFQASKSLDCSIDGCLGNNHYWRIINVCRTCGYQADPIIESSPHDLVKIPETQHFVAETAGHWYEFTYRCLICTIEKTMKDPTSFTSHAFSDYYIGGYTPDSIPPYLYHHKIMKADCTVPGCTHKDQYIDYANLPHEFKDCCGCEENACDPANLNTTFCLNCYSFDLDPNDQSRHIKWKRSECVQCKQPRAGIYVVSECHHWGTMPSGETVCVDCFTPYDPSKTYCSE